MPFIGSVAVITNTVHFMKMQGRSSILFHDADVRVLRTDLVEIMSLMRNEARIDF